MSDSDYVIFYDILYFLFIICILQIRVPLILYVQWQSKTFQVWELQILGSVISPLSFFLSIQKLASLVSMPKRSQFMHRLLAFWTLKRQSRNGVPLLRRLTTSHSRRSNRSPEEKSTEYKDKEKILSVSYFLFLDYASGEYCANTAGHAFLM